MSVSQTCFKKFYFATVKKLASFKLSDKQLSLSVKVYVMGNANVERHGTFDFQLDHGFFSSRQPILLILSDVLYLIYIDILWRNSILIAIILGG